MIILAHKDRPQIEQKTTHPSVYFDQCFLQKFSFNKTLLTEFADILIKRNGTLFLSWVHILESAGIKDNKNIVIETFLEKLMPYIGFIDAIPNKVIQREDEILRKRVGVEPHADRELLKFFGDMERKPIYHLTINGLFSYFAKQEKINRMREVFLMTYKTQIIDRRKLGKRIRIDYRNINKIPHATRYIFPSLINLLISNEIKIEESNHFRDLFHATVPLAYCDSILLEAIS